MNENESMTQNAAQTAAPIAAQAAAHNEAPTNGPNPIPGRIVAFIAAYTEANHWGPTYNEIAAACGLCSAGHVSYYLNPLLDAGTLTQIPRSGRTLRVADGVDVVSHNIPHGAQVAGG